MSTSFRIEVTGALCDHDEGCHGMKSEKIYRRVRVRRPDADGSFLFLEKRNVDKG